MSFYFPSPFPSDLLFHLLSPTLSLLLFSPLLSMSIAFVLPGPHFPLAPSLPLWSPILPSASLTRFIFSGNYSALPLHYHFSTSQRRCGSAMGRASECVRACVKLTLTTPSKWHSAASSSLMFQFYAWIHKAHSYHFNALLKVTPPPAFEFVYVLR